MAVRTEVLTKLILHKRERITQSLPQLISQTGDEKHTAEKIARKARSNKENLESKITNLKTERKLVTQVFSCLLYTSPSPRDKRQSRMPSSA